MDISPKGEIKQHMVLQRAAACKRVVEMCVPLGQLRYVAFYTSHIDSEVATCFRRGTAYFCRRPIDNSQVR